MNEYEKKYKEILDAARYWHDVSEGDIPVVLEEIFPELRESEDEKIRKRIIQVIKIREKEMNEEWSNEIAWLEKQGQKFTWSEEDEKMLIDCFNVLHRSDYPEDKVKKTTLWVKSLKNRII